MILSRNVFHTFHEAKRGFGPVMQAWRSASEEQPQWWGIMEKQYEVVIYDMESFLSDHGIEYATGGSTVTSGWIGVHCPFCAGTKRYHLGYKLSKGYWKCWRCGFHSMREVIDTLFGPTAREVARRLATYATDLSRARFVHLRGDKEAKKTPLILPATAGAFSARSRAYLEHRNYDPDQLVREWGIGATGPMGDYKFRIIIPVMLNNQLVSYQGRDYTGKSEMKYKACRGDDEIVSIKDTVYGIDQVKGKTVMVTEGVPNVWRLGPGSVATFGISITPAQVYLLAKRFDRFFILFDKDDDVIIEPEASVGSSYSTPHESAHAARKLGMQLSLMGKEAHILTMEGANDPGDLPPEEAHALMREYVRQRR